MKLTKFQKELIDHFINDKIVDIESFAQHYFVYEPEKYKSTKNHSSAAGYNFRKDEEVDIIVDPESTILKTLEFTRLLKFLIQNEIIFLDEFFYNPSDAVRIFTRSHHDPLPIPLTKFYALTKDYRNKAIQDIDLDGFKKRKYILLEQAELDAERESRKKAQRMTLIISIFAILVSGASFIFNLTKSKRPQEIVITNEKLFPDTTAVKLIHSSYDTSGYSNSRQINSNTNNEGAHSEQSINQ
jgi:hypothetical protein